tara:strand:- start:825 stop:944 length:120 start_codon:yes stop_codon:yes gene_type:complete
MSWELITKIKTNMKNKIINILDNFERKYIKGDAIYWLIV